MLNKIGNISCREATFLMSKKEDMQTTRAENIKLKFHILICTSCRRFAKQTAFITKNARFAAEYTHATLSDAVKQRIKNLME